MPGYQRSSRTGTLIRVVVAGTICTLSASVAAVQDAYSIVHAFDRGIDGRQPQTSLVRGNDGNLYGTTSRGGVYDSGTIFRLAPDGTETVLHSFDVYLDGTSPSALIQGSDGNFYGTAGRPLGRTPFGIIFRMTPDGTFTILHGFTCGADGANPVASLVEADDGRFYGVTTGSASDECVAPATVFRMSVDGTLTTIHALVSGSDGTAPTAPLIQAQDGNLYGTAQAGGPFLGGTVFRVTTDGTLTLLHAFHYPDDAEGRGPRAALVEGDNGRFYGTTTWGGRCFNCGTVFRLTDDGTLEVVYAFQQGSDAGTLPYAPLTRRRDGMFYGTTCGSGGAVFQMTPDGDLTVVHAFAANADGGCPQGALLETEDGGFYGTAPFGGSSGSGTIFRVTGDGTFDVLYAFPGSEEGRSPTTLLQAADGAIYGIAAEGGAFNRGTVFRLTDDGSALDVHTFTGDVDGAVPSALIQATDGTFYGLTTSGGDAGGGTFFQLAADGSFAALYSFSADRSTSAPPSGGLLQATDGDIYGTTAWDGDYGRGAVFRWTRAGTLTILHSFAGGAEGVPIGLLQATDGNFYGATYAGGGPGNRIFRMEVDGTVTTLYTFPVGQPVIHGLIEADDGSLYFISNNDIMRMTFDGHVTLVHSFAPSEGDGPQGMIQTADGNLLGTTYISGALGGGTVFRLSLAGALTVLHPFPYAGDLDGRTPRAAPILANEGALYGTTSLGGGPGNQGVVYRLILDEQLQRRRMNADAGHAHEHANRRRTQCRGTKPLLASRGEQPR
jgi:uncharacterized repeat protein (TIGR03803 family)